MNTATNRFLFIAGLHRTGTSILSQIIGAHPDVSAIESSPAPENEGCYLQGAIPHTALHGRPGHYATDPAQHHAETSHYNSLETKRRMLADWNPWFDPSRRWWLEKSPVNLTRMRLYQQLFPTCQFVVILRHPQVMAAALAKWVDDAPATLVDYALDAYDIMERDIEFLHSVMVLRYEDLVARPKATIHAIHAFLSLPEQRLQHDLHDGNARYAEFADLDSAARARLSKWGYRDAADVTECAPLVRHPLRDVREASLHAWAR